MNIDELYTLLDCSKAIEPWSTKEDRALFFAAGSHNAVGQKRKYTGEPYINHPIEAVRILKAVLGTDVSVTQLCSAYLHDTIEDTQVCFNDLVRFFGDEVAEMVLELTDVSKPTDGNRATRKKIDLEHYSKVSKEAADVKLADLISNTRSIVEHDKNFAKVYVKEKEALLGVLQHADTRMINMASQALSKARLDMEV